MTSATVTGAYSTYPTWLFYRIIADEIATNIAANQSTVRVRAFIISTVSASSSGGSGTTTAGNWSRGFTSFGSSGGTLEVFSTSFVVNHNPDGSGSYSFNGSSSMGGWGSASTPTGTVTLTNFDFTPSAPASCTASVLGGVITVTAGNATSYRTPVSYFVSYASSTNGGVSYGSWSSESTMTAQQFSYSGLTPGLTYKFRVRAYNGVDNYSAYTESSPLFLTAGGKRFTGTNWALTATAAKRYNGLAWVNLTTAKRYDGTNWVNLS